MSFGFLAAIESLAQSKKWLLTRDRDGNDRGDVFGLGRENDVADDRAAQVDALETFGTEAFLDRGVEGLHRLLATEFLGSGTHIVEHALDRVRLERDGRIGGANSRRRDERRGGQNECIAHMCSPSM